MAAILQKIKADIISRPLISVLVVATITTSSALLALALITLMNLSAPYDRSFEELNGAHLWLYFNRDRIRSRDIDWIEALPNVVESTGLQYSVESRIRFKNSQFWTSLRVIPLTLPAVNRLLVRRGRYLEPRQTEVLASKDLNDLYKMSVGDEIGITREDGKEIKLPVIGLAYNPTWDTYRSSQPPYLYVTEDTLNELFPNDSDWDWSIGLRLADPEAVDETLALIENKLRSHAIDSHTDWRDVRESAIFGAQLTFVVLGAFGFFAILATILVVASSISSIVLSQYKQIGMLKAIGFTRSQILWLYMGQYLALSLIGSPLGLLLGLALSPLPLQSVAASLSTSFKPAFNSGLAILVFSIIPGVVTLATLTAAYNGAKANIIKAIAVGAEAPHRKPFWGVRIAAKLGLPMIFVLGLNDVFAKPFRSFMTGLNLTLGVIGIVFGLTLSETIEAYIDEPSLLGIPYDATVTRSYTSDRRTQHLLRRAPGVEAFYGQYIVEAETLSGQSFQARAVAGDLANFPFKITKGRFFRSNTYEAVAGRGLLDWLGLSVGDELTLILDEKDNKPTTWRVVGQYPEPANAGQMLMLSLPTVARTIKNVKPNSYHLKLADNRNVPQLRRHLEPKPDSDLDLILVDQAIPGDIKSLQLAVIALAAILIGIALVNVFNTSMLAMQEKVKVIGILKTVGMTPVQVVTMINATAGFLGLLATAFGIPLGFIFTKVLLAGLSEFYGFGEVEVTLNFLYIILIIPLMIVVSTMGSFIPGQQAAKLSIVRVLRHE